MPPAWGPQHDIKLQQECSHTRTHTYKHTMPIVAWYSHTQKGRWGERRGNERNRENEKEWREKEKHEKRSETRWSVVWIYPFMLSTFAVWLLIFWRWLCVASLRSNLKIGGHASSNGNTFEAGPPILCLNDARAQTRTHKRKNTHTHTRSHTLAHTHTWHTRSHTPLTPFF